MQPRVANGATQQPAPRASTANREQQPADPRMGQQQEAAKHLPPQQQAGKAATSGTAPTATSEAQKPQQHEPTSTTEGKAPNAMERTGISLSALFAEQSVGPAQAQVATTNEATKAAESIDPMTEQKIRRAEAAILEMIRHDRPRFYPAFERMQLQMNTISIRVATRELHDEIRRNQLSLLTHIARMAEVNGKIELDIQIDETVRAERPIKLEDRIRYLTEKNPLFTELRKVLDMEVE